MPSDSNRKPKKKGMERQHGIPGIQVRVKAEVKEKVRVKEKAKEKVKVERKVEKEKENGINGINHHMGETPLCHMGETPIRMISESCKENVKNGYCMVIVAAAFNVPWTTILTAKVLEKERSPKAKEKEKKAKEKEEARRASMEASQLVKKANQGLTKDLGPQQVGELPLVPLLMVRPTDLIANIF